MDEETVFNNIQYP